jgi:O-acetyl-ADP-ribose deacetylase (regulator of RNase III)
MLKELDYILEILLKEQNHYPHIVPSNINEKLKLMRMLMNMRNPLPVTQQFLQSQDIVLKELRQNKNDVLLENIPHCAMDKRIRLWLGDITRLKVDAIVNAANSQMLGCFHPLHGCIDNAIHSAAGIQLRLECNELIKLQGFEEPSGSAKITNGYNLPAKHVIHTVGPIIHSGKPSVFEENQLASCYQTCLQLADQHQLKSIAFCCISTGEFRFPNQRAAEIVIRTVLNYFEKNRTTSIDTVVFNVFKDLDFSIYQTLLKDE